VVFPLLLWKPLGRGQDSAQWVHGCLSRQAEMEVNILWVQMQSVLGLCKQEAKENHPAWAPSCLCFLVLDESGGWVLSAAPQSGKL
jgi:hypothetical protein